MGQKGACRLLLSHFSGEVHKEATGVMVVRFQHGVAIYKRVGAPRT